MALNRATSQRSGISDASSAAEAASRLHKRHALGGSHADEEDLLEDKKTLQEAVFSSMYTLARSKTTDSRAWVTAKIILEGLIPFLLVFNPDHWPLDTSNAAWQVVRWALPRLPIARIWSYDVYIRVFYVLVALIYSVVVAIAALTIAMRRQEQSKWLRRAARFLQKFTELMFAMLYVAIFDYILFLFDCRFGAPGHPHYYWTDIQCLSGSHAINLAVAAVTGVVFFVATALMLVAVCDLSPVARGILASPAAFVRLQVLVLKALFVIASDTLATAGKAQAVLMMLLAFGILYVNLKALPFLRLYINNFWVGVWAVVSYMCTVHVVMDMNDDRNAHSYVMIVLYGIVPAFLAGCFLAFLWGRYRLRPADKFAGLDPAEPKPPKLHKFPSPADVEFLARAMRRFNSDGVLVEEWARLGETIVKYGMEAFPNDISLLVLYANFLLDVRRDGPAARTQLQLALKAGPSPIQRYQIFCTIENSKRLKDGQEGTLDLQSYVEFKRNYRAVIRVHKSALAAQRDVWQLMQRPVVRTSAVEAALRAMAEAADAAHQVYRRVLDRYPNNGKLLRCYGKFLEDVRHDPLAAARAYAGAARNGGGEGLLSLDLQFQGANKPEFITTMDMHEDACIIINAEGNILMVNSCVTELLGYYRAELEGSNVSMIMPQPFSGRHNGYLERYKEEGHPHILDSVRDVVALHKDRYVFPLQLCVTKLSGIGKDAVFLGVLRPAPFDARNVRAWVAPNGVILCTDPQFASLTGVLGEELVGRNFRTLVTDMAAVDSLLDLCKDVPYEQLLTGNIVLHLEMAHRYLPPIPIEVKVTPGGTDAQRIMVFNAHRTDGNTDGLMVVDTRGGLAFATWDVAAMLGYPLRSFLRVRLEQLLPQPFSTMHAKYLRNAPPTVPVVSCRTGMVVNMVNANGSQVPVRLRITTKEDDQLASDGSHVRHVVQVTKVDTSSVAMYSDKRLALICTMDGTILSVDQPNSNLFGFAASAVVGSNLGDCIDVFNEWRVKAGAHQLELLLLSMLDKEAEMPGTSWRVKVHSPETDGPENHLPDIVARPRTARPRTAATRRPVGRSACLQTEIVDSSELFGSGLDLEAAAGSKPWGVTTGMAPLSAAPSRSALKTPGPAPEDGGDSAGLKRFQSGAGQVLARIILWRRDLLTGVVELDDKLVIRKADVSTGLIVGLPPSALQRLPLYRLLDINKGITWDDLTVSDRKKSALKGPGIMRMSEPKAFIGPHPDGGTMRIIMQGVSGGGAGGRVTATLHPDTTYVGARANVYRALGLEALIAHQLQRSATRPLTRQQMQRQMSRKFTLRRRGSSQKVLLPQEQQAHQQVTAGALAQGAPLRGGSRVQLGPVADQGPDEASAQRLGAQLRGTSRVQLVLDDAEDTHQQAGNKAADATTGNQTVDDARTLAKVEVGPAAGAAELPDRKRGKAGGAEGLENDLDDAEGELGDEDGDEEGDEDDDDDDNGSSSSSSKDSDGSNSSRIRRAETRKINLDKRNSSSNSTSSSKTSSSASRGAAGSKGQPSRRGSQAAGAPRTASRGAAAGGEAEAAARGGKGGRQDGTATDAEAAQLYKGSESQSQFITQWVRSLSRQMTAAGILRSAANSKPESRKSLLPNGAANGGDAAAGSRLQSHGAGAGGAMGGMVDDDTAALLIRASTRLLASGLVGDAEKGRGISGAGAVTRRKRDDEDPPIDPLLIQRTEIEPETAQLAEKDDGGVSRALTRPGSARGDLAHGDEGRRTSVEVTGKGKVPPAPGSDGGGSSLADDDEDGSQGTGGPGLSDFTSGVDVDLATDARRARLLKRMMRVMFGPSLAAPLARLYSHTILLLIGMAAAHVICYAVLMALITEEYAQVHALHRTALAADRCQVTSLKGVVMDFCNQPGIEPVSACASSLTSTVSDLRSSLEDLESYHQSIYLGVTQVPKRLADSMLFNLWTSAALSYKVLLDVDPPRWINLTSGVWQLGNRFVAAGRELLYWAPRLGGTLRGLRSYQFILANGPWSLFRGYTLTLDRMAYSAWEDVTVLERNLIIILLVELVVVMLACIAYEWWLVRHVELGRCSGMLVGLGLPGPILRILVNRPLVVVEDSDEETEEAEEDDGPHDAGAAAGGGHAYSDGAYGPPRRSIHAGDAATASAPLPGRASLDYSAAQGRTAAVRTGRASIDFAPLRGPAELSGGAAGRPTDGMPYHHPRARLSVDFPQGAGGHRRTGRASIDFAPLRVAGGVPGDVSAGTIPAVYGHLPYAFLPPPPPPTEAPLPALPGALPVRWSAAGLRQPAPAVLAVEVLPMEPTSDPSFEKTAPVTAAAMGHGVYGSAASGVSGVSGTGAASGAWDGGRRGLAAVAVTREGSNQVAINGKVLVAGRRHLLKFMLPLLVAELCLAGVGILSYMWLEGMQGPLASLNMASHVIYRYTRVRMCAFFLVSSNSTAERTEWRSVMSTELDNLRDEYETLLYGGVSSTQVGSEFQRPVPASTFESSSFAANFFREERCFRWDQSNCYTRDSPYYEATHHGLDAMMRRVMSEVALLAADDDSDAVYNGTHYTTVYMVGVKDLYEGLQSSAQLFVDFMISRYQNIKLLNTILLVVLLVLLLAYGIFVLRPYRAAVTAEATRLAGLLSHVPVEIDVVVHARLVMQEYGKVMGTEDAETRRRRQKRASVVSTRGALIRDVPRRRASGGGVSGAKVPLLGSGV